MRTFNYRNLPNQLVGGPVGAAAARIHEHKGKLELLGRMYPEELAALRNKAHFDNVEASTHIEGIYVDADQARAAVADDAALKDGTAHAATADKAIAQADEAIAQVAGYSRALRLVEGHAGDLELSTAAIIRLYEELYGHRNLGKKSRYRKKDYMYVQTENGAKAMPVSPITAFETPLVLGGACDSLAEAFDAQTPSPVVLAAVFTVDFLCIRPFDEGNGRISRLFADLLLMKAGFDVARYVSVDRIVEGSAMAYYDALNACTEGWDRARNDYTPYVLYWLDVLDKAYTMLFELVEPHTAKPAGKSERVAAFVRSSTGPVTKQQIRDALPSVSEATIEAALGKMVKDGAAEKVGAGRATAYRWRA